MRILFVCLGNICRSPLAEGVLRHLLKETPLQWTVDSAGTANYHVGEKPDSRTIKNAASHGVDLETLRARQFQTSDFDKFDLIYAMDKNNHRRLLSLAGSESDKAKVKLFLRDTLAGNFDEVPDPYYGGPEDFEAVFQLVNSACIKLIERQHAD